MTHRFEGERTRMRDLHRRERSLCGRSAQGEPLYEALLHLLREKGFARGRGRG